jgi:hypothetical protein
MEMTKPTKTEYLADSTSTAPLVAATSTVDDVRKARQDNLTAANQVVSDRKDAVAAAEAALESARSEADLYAEALATGMPQDPAALRGYANEIAVLTHELEILREALAEAERLAVAAGVDHLKARWHCAQRDARAARRPEGDARLRVADAVDALVKAVEAAHSATLARVELDRGVLQLRDDLWGTDASARNAGYDTDIELWRILMALPTAWLEEIRAHHTTGDVDMRAKGAEYIALANDA